MMYGAVKIGIVDCALKAVHMSRAVDKLGEKPYLDRWTKLKQAISMFYGNRITVSFHRHFPPTPG
jgi:hypothetical protein